MSYANYQKVIFYIVSSVFCLSNEKHKDNHHQRNDFSYQLVVCTCKKKTCLKYKISCYRNGAIHDVLHRYIKRLNNPIEILIFLHFISIINICHVDTFLH